MGWDSASCQDHGEAFLEAGIGGPESHTFYRQSPRIAPFLRNALR